MVSLDVVNPVLNEEHSLPLCIDKLKAFLDKEMDEYDCRIVIADNGSTDRTWQLAETYAYKYPERISCIHLDERGRGRALKKAAPIIVPMALNFMFPGLGAVYSGALGELS